MSRLRADWSVIPVGLLKNAVKAGGVSWRCAESEAAFYQKMQDSRSACIPSLRNPTKPRPAVAIDYTVVGIMEFTGPWLSRGLIHSADRTSGLKGGSVERL
jgi:hypothetical protein